MAGDFGARTRSFVHGGGGILDSRRQKKNELYLAKIESPGHQGPRLVAEGDSWFEYPFSQDIIMQLSAKYAVLGLAKAADSFEEVNAQNELMPTLAHPPLGKPFHIVMLSLGGNEVMGHIEDFVLNFQLGRPDEDYVDFAAFNPMLANVRAKLASIVKKIVDNGAQHVILHGYDYPDARLPPDLGEPANGSQWIGPPLKVHRNIESLPTYRCAANMMLDRFNAMLQTFAQQPEHQGRVHYVSLLGTIGIKDHHHDPVPPQKSLWNDEIHGNDKGFARVAKKFEPVIDSIWASLHSA